MQSHLKAVMNRNVCSQIPFGHLSKIIFPRVLHMNLMDTYSIYVIITPNALREWGKVIGLGVHIYMYIYM